MRPSTLDPTAGERARQIGAHPGAAQPILDPTDPRYGEFLLDPSEQASQVQRVFDPTNPRCGDAPA